jgi:probable rRNA maturation factor
MRRVKSNAMNKVKVVIVNRQNDVKIPTGIRLLVRRCCNASLRLEGFTEDAEIDVSFVSNEEIQALNAKYRGKDAVTDVLSFPLGENGRYDKNETTGALLLGDIVISMPKAVEQAEFYGHSLQREVGFLTTHAMFHLLGYDHEAGGVEAVKMREKEETVLGMLGIPKGASYVME